MEFLRRRIGLILRSLVSLLLIAWLVRKIDWHKFLTIVATAHVGWLVVGALCFSPVLVTVSWRWRMLLGVHGVHLRFWRIFELTMIGQFFSAFLLGTTGGDVIKIYYVARAVPDRKAAVAFTVIVDRVIGMIALLLFGTALSLPYVGLFWSLHFTKVYTALFYLIALGGVVGSILACFGPLLLKHQSIRNLVKRVPMAHRGTSLYAAFEQTARAIGTNLIALIASFPSHICTTLMGYCVLRSLNQPFQLIPFCAILAIVNMLIALPISVAGIGWREFLFVTFFGLLHIDADYATAFSLTYFTLNLIWSLAGVPFYFLYRHETHAPPPDTTAVEPIFSET